MTAELRTERRDATLVLTLADPATRNRLGTQLVAAAIEALNVADADDSLRCVVLHGAGADFCAGAALATSGLGAQDAAGEEWRRCEELVQLVEALRAFARPVIAALEGLSGGAGLALMQACDLVVAASDARFAADAAGAGADAAAQACFAASLPRAVALQWLWAGGEARGLANELAACGAVQRVCAPGQALAAACDWAAELAAAAPRDDAKAWIDAAPGLTLAQQLRAAHDRLAAGLLHAQAPSGRQRG